MSADMQDAGYLFGCDAMLHIIDVFSPDDRDIKTAFNMDTLENTDKRYANCFLPVVINKSVQRNFILNEKLSQPELEFKNNICYFSDIENKSFASEIQKLKNSSSNLYLNFSESFVNSEKIERSVFHKLYFLNPNIIDSLKKRKIGNNAKEDIALIKKLPKADLHSHLGGVLSSNEIIETALAETDQEFNDEKFYKEREIEKFIKLQDINALKKIK